MEGAGQGAMGRLKGLLRRGGRGGEPSTPAVRVACFGKHPGWEDHMEHLGVDTDHLVGLWQSLYENGVRANLDRGAWGAPELDPAHRLPGFDHMFLWRDGETIDLGLMWASRDRRGRADYPMIACVSATAMGLDWVCTRGPGVLEALRDACRGTEERDGVLQARATAQRDLEAAAEGQTPVSFLASAQGAVARLRNSGQFEREPEQFFRWLYHLQREFGVCDGNPPPKGASTTAQHVRVPALGDDPVESLRLWTAAMGAVLPGMPVLVSRALGREWVDLCVGTPGVREIFQLLVGPGVSPLVTEIPYEIDAADRARLNAACGLPGR